MKILYPSISMLEPAVLFKHYATTTIYKIIFLHDGKTFYNTHLASYEIPIGVFWQLHLKASPSTRRNKYVHHLDQVRL